MRTTPEIFTYIGLQEDDISRMRANLPNATFRISPQVNTDLFDVEVIVYPVIPDTSYLSNGRIRSRNF